MIQQSIEFALYKLNAIQAYFHRWKWTVLPSGRCSIENCDIAQPPLFQANKFRWMQVAFACSKSFSPGSSGSFIGKHIKISFPKLSTNRNNSLFPFVHTFISSLAFPSPTPFIADILSTYCVPHRNPLIVYALLSAAMSTRCHEPPTIWCCNIKPWMAVPPSSWSSQLIRMLSVDA